MKKNKIILLIVLAFFLSGCSVKYNIVFTDNLKINESLSLNELNTIFLKNGSNNKVYIDTMVDIYENNEKYNSYKIIKKIGNVSSGVVAEKKNQDFQDYQKNNGVKKTLFGQIFIDENNNNISFNATDYRGKSFFDEDDTSDYLFDDVIVEIKLPFYVIEHNADKFDEKKGVYTWFFDKNIDEKEIKIVFENKISIIKKIIILIKKFLFIFILLAIIILIVILIFIRYKQVNKI